MTKSYEKRSMVKWISDVQKLAEESLERLRNGDSSVEQCRAEAAQIKNIAHSISERIKYAKAAGLIVGGSNKLADVRLNDGEE